MQEHTTEEEDTRFVDGIRVVERPHFALVRVNPKAVVVLLGATAMVAAGFAFVLTHFKETRTAAVAVLQTATPPVRDPYTYFPRWGFAAILPPGWEEVTDSVPLPIGIMNTYHTYTRADTSCILAYVPFPTHTAQYIESAPAQEVFRSGTSSLISVIERATPYEHAHATSATTHDAPFTTHEIAYAYYPLFYDNGSDHTSHNAWALFTDDTTPIPTVCAEEYEAVLDSLRTHHTTRTLSEDDTGILYIETDEIEGTHLLYRNEDAADVYRIATLADGMIYKPTLVDTTLFYVNTYGALTQYDLFADTPPTVIPLGISEGESVNDFLVTHDVIYSLAGVWCGGYTMTCNLSLLAYDRHTTATTTIAVALTDRHIQGVSADMRIYLSYEESDTDTSWGTWHACDLPTGDCEEVYRFDAEAEQTRQEHEETVASLMRGLIPIQETARSVRIAPGVITRGPETFEGSESLRVALTLSQHRSTPVE